MTRCSACGKTNVLVFVEPDGHYCRDCYYLRHPDRKDRKPRKKKKILISTWEISE